MAHRTIFWPEDVRASGICYGRRLLSASQSPEAEATLAELCAHTQYPRLAAACGGNPVVLGTRVLEPASRNPTLKLHFGIEEYTVIYYHRHAATSLRSYSLENAEPREEAPMVHRTRDGAYATAREHDFTRSARNSGGINSVMINQFNTAKTLDALLSKYLFDIMDAALYLPKRVFPLLRIPAYMKDFSTTVQQLDVRTEQAEFLVHEVQPLRQHNLNSVAVFSARYTNFFNTVWLILNDITIGVAFGSFLCENHVVLAQIVNQLVEVYLIDWLNTELSRFYSHAFSDLVGVWGYVLHRGAPYLPGTLYAFGVFSGSGMTSAIALLSDLLALLTLHIYVGYVVTQALYALLLRIGGSLWNLFRGKRFNVLRNRTDAWAYDTDQLLFGTILFTLLAFLFPTVLAYYALFALMRMGTILLNEGLETQLAFMNHFPLFALMLRAKDPWRLPGGIFFSVEYDASGLVLIVKNQPVPFSTIFVQYIRLWSRLAAHYNPLRLLWCVLRERVVAIPRYEMRYLREGDR
ncbi:N-acetylglucosaminyl transferase component-domain-containing protein [Mycena galericulata]|nr:N-acetylglucosaminyl transferase component-domain-containing protein [Mycena galericulata]